MTPNVRERDIDNFWHNGAVCLRKIADRAWIDRLREATEWALAYPVGMELGEHSLSRYYAELFPWRRHRTFEEFCLVSGIAAVPRALARTETVRLFYDYLLVKEPGGSPATPWHQDQPYYPAVGSDVCSMWVALDEVTRANGGLEYLAGSHLWNKVFSPESIQGGFDRAELEKVPDVDAQRDRYDLLSWDLEPGDCVVHHSLTVHGGPPNDSPLRRRGIAVRWIYGDVRFVPMPNTSPQLAAVAREAGLQPGDPFAGPMFPEPR